MIKRLAFIGSLLLAAVSSQAATWYMSPTGSDSNGGTSYADGVRTSTKAAALMSAGDTVNVGAGTYASGFLLSDFDKGTSTSAFSVIQCTTTFGARITQSNSGVLTGNTSWFYQFKNIVLDGVNQKSFEGHDAEFIQCGFKGGPATGQNSVNTAVGTSDFQPTTDFLFEDCFWVGYSTGSGRYCLVIYQAERVVVRRPIFWMGNGWTDSGSNPSAAFTIYNSSQVSVQNPVVLDITSFPRAASGQWSGAYYFVTNSLSAPNLTHGSGFNEYLGAIAFNIHGTGFYNDGNLSDLSTTTITDSLFLDCTSYVMALGNGSGSHSFALNRLTISLTSSTANASEGYGIVKNDSGGDTTATNIIVANEPDGDFYRVSPTYFDTYNNGSATAGTGQQTYNPRTNGLTYFPRIEAASNLKTAGSSGGQIGAEIKFKYGTDGTMWGDSGYNTLSSNVLWPWPNQAALRTEFCAAYSTGWCAGSTTTLTQYLHNFSTSPYSDASDTTPPTPPTSLSTTSVAPTTMGISYTAGADGVGVTSYELDVSASSDFSSFVGSYNDLDIGLVTSYTITGLTQSTTYYFRLRAKDAAVNTSVNSATGTGTTPAAVRNTIQGNVNFSGKVSFQ